MSISFAQVEEGVVVRKEGGYFWLPDHDGKPIGSVFEFLCQPLHVAKRLGMEAAKPFDDFTDEDLLPWCCPPCFVVLGAGVTFSNSLRERRLEAIRAGELRSVSDDGRPTPYDVVYDSINPPEVFFKALDLGHLADHRTIKIRSDGAPEGGMGSSVPEPERVLLINPACQIVAHTIGSDTTARQLESRSPLYLPAAKTYLGCTTLCPWVTLYEEDVEVMIQMQIFRDGTEVYQDAYSSKSMKRTPESLVSQARTLAPHPGGVFPFGFALFSGTGIIPPIDFSLQSGDRVIISSPQLGVIDAVTEVVNMTFAS